MNLPNLLTISRLCAIPILMVCLIASFPGHDQWAAGIFLLASATDVLDGNLARWQGRVTELGKFLDPLVDKLFILSVLIALVQVGELAAWVVLVIFGRELLITVLRSVSAAQGRVISATPWGKTKTASQVGAVFLLILQRPYPVLSLAAYTAIYLAVVFTVLSGIDYLWRFRHVLWHPEAKPVPTVAAAGGAPGSESPVDPLAVRLAAALGRSGQTLAAAESCTGGLLAELITDQPGSSEYFLGGVVSYTNEVKRKVLGVPEADLRSHGAVSEEVARAMAEGVRRVLGADLGISITGIAGPGAEGTSKPVGLTYLWLASEGGGAGRVFTFGGDRWANRRQAASEALRLLLDELAKANPGD